MIFFCSWYIDVGASKVDEKDVFCFVLFFFGSFRLLRMKISYSLMFGLFSLWMWIWQIKVIELKEFVMFWVRQWKVSVASHILNFFVESWPSLAGLSTINPWQFSLSLLCWIFFIGHTVGQVKLSLAVMNTRDPKAYYHWFLECGGEIGVTDLWIGHRFFFWPPLNLRS